MSAKKEDLIAIVQENMASAEMEVTKKAASEITDIVLNSVLQTAKAHESVRTVLGTFKFAEKPAREAINPRTGEKVQVPANKNLTFKALKSIKEVVAPVKKAAAKKPVAAKK